MINVVNRRNNGMECTPITSERSPSQALYSLVKFELGYGGMIVDASETSITVRTQVLNCVDHTTFSGSKEDMQSLVETAYYFMKACAHDGGSIDEVVKQLSATNKGLRAFYLVNLAPMLLGRKRLMVATMLGMGITEVDDINFGITLSLDDLMALLELVSDAPGHSLKELAAEFGVTSTTAIAA